MHVDTYKEYDRDKGKQSLLENLLLPKIAAAFLSPVPTHLQLCIQLINLALSEIETQSYLILDFIFAS